jgi:hypothetical protein
LKVIGAESRSQKPESRRKPESEPKFTGIKWIKGINPDTGGNRFLNREPE